jgi:glucose/mannose-6-phosphate isomerase
LIDHTTLEKFDVSKMYKVYDEWPQIASEAYANTIKRVDFTGIDHVVFAGMGGSGTLGDVFASILSKSRIHVSVVKGYLLPRTVDVNSLVITTSVSGNTQEVLTILDAAKNANCKITAFSSGGMMRNYCVKNNITYVDIPQIHSPRASFVRFLYSMLKSLSSVIPVEKTDVDESIKYLEQFKNNISSSNLNEQNSALELARWIKDIPIIYYPLGLQAAAIRFKNSLQENAKIHAMTEDVIEACHNGVVAWQQNSTVRPILIQGVDDYYKTKERWMILKEYFGKNNIEYKEVFSVKGSILSKIINLIYLLDYSSIYRAVLSGIDPTPVDAIKFIKNKLTFEQ